MGDSQLVLGAMGFFMVAGTLLGLSGISGATILIPGGQNAEEGGTTQGFTGAVIECVFSIFRDCSTETVTTTFSIITDIVAFISSYLFFFLQLLTFQLPIPGWMNAVIVLPPAVVMMYVGLKLVRGGG